MMHPELQVCIAWCFRSQVVSQMRPAHQGQWLSVGSTRSGAWMNLDQPQGKHCTCCQVEEHQVQVALDHGHSQGER